MKKHFILLSALVSLQTNAFSPNHLLSEFIKNAIFVLTKINASMAAQGSNSTPQAPAGSSRQNNSHAATPPSPTVAGSSDLHYVNQNKLEDFLKSELKKASVSIKNKNCPKKDYIDQDCIASLLYKNNLYNLFEKVRIRNLTKEEIIEIRSMLIQEINELKIVINLTDSLCSALKKSNYVNREYLSGSRETLLQQDQLLNQLASRRQALKEIFDISI